MIPSAKLKEILKIHKQDLGDYNLAPVIADAYLQGGKECVVELKELFDGAGIDKKLFNDAIEKIITDLLRAAVS
ncbi:MAG TPA: hypothetical protein H9964_00220 [Candidatus Gallimonas intestinavium]|uniref:Uncharacterized protein n=1 Tax=Candidatus Gallimonas intestinavium TaxID=2838603 RepID=A0A9D2G3Z5_9FIRM|nr:hypothetical protein [Candidatus Gallimonas intestinavium]